MIKLCADTAIQIDVDDALRGHVFAVQDALFWVAFIVSITVAGDLGSRRRARAGIRAVADRGSTCRPGRCTA